MEQVETPTGRWTISVRSSGDALAVQAGGHGLDLGFLGIPSAFTAPEIETWLTELVGMAGRTGNDSPVLWDPAPSIPIPRTLHQALTGLLFYEAEVWGGTGERHPCTVACLTAGTDIAFGWVGSGRIEIRLDGQPFDPVWVLVRDQVGRSAHAFVADALVPLEVRVTWPADSGETEVAGGEIEARWPGLPGKAPGNVGELQLAPPVESAESASVEVPLESASSGGSEPEPRAFRRRGFWQFRGWMDRLSGQRASGSAQLDPIALDVPGVPVLLPDPEPIVKETPAVMEAMPELVVVEAPAVAEAMPAAVCEPSVDPFDLGPLAALKSEPAVAEPVAPVEPAPDAAVPVVAREPMPEPEPALAGAVATPAPWPEARPDETATGAAHLGQRPAVRRPAWPEPEEDMRSAERPVRQGRWFILAVVAVLFAAGWLLGRADFPRAGKDLGSAFKAIGLGPARYEVTVASRPSGAWIAVDGVDQTRRTPATLELKPGTHEIGLTFSGVGGSIHTVNGRRGQRVPLDVELWGSLKVVVPGGSVPISVAVDGVHRGYAPLEVEQLQPGIHRLQFSGPGVAPWEQTVEVHVNRTVELLAQPVASPATGMLEVRATLADETGSEPLTGAQVWIDGQLLGVTPLKVELPRGPHSIRVRYRNEDGPVQVIELPGGNLRYANVQLGLSADAPRLVATLPDRVHFDRPTVLSTSLDGVREGDVREMLLHVRTPEGAWRRYPMTLMKAPGGLVGVAVFPTVLFDARARAAWYVSASTPMGDEYFTEIRAAQAAPRP